MVNRRNRRYNRRRGTRRTGSRNLAKTLRNRGKSKVGLNTRVTLANRQQIRQIKKSIDTIMVDTVQGLAVNDFDGQYNDSINLDKDGVEVAANIPFCPSLLRIPRDRRVGSWLQMKSMTMKYCVTAGARSGQFQRIYMMLVLDTHGGADTGGDLSSVLALESAVPPPNNRYALAFQNLSNTGKEGRFKILWRQTHTVSAAYNSSNVPQTVAPEPATPAPIAQAAYAISTTAAKAYPLRVYGSVTLKRPYKFNYGQDPTTVPVPAEGSPENQTIRLYSWTEAPYGATGSANDLQLQYYTRFRFKDA